MSKHIRLVVYCQDVMKILGKSERASRRVIAAIRKSSGGRSLKFIPIEHFCSYTGLDEEVVKSMLN